MVHPQKKRPPSDKSKKHGSERSGADDRVQPRRQDATRETIESVVVAFILAFMFRTFEAEAFVIPTGSMAPTLVGQHKEVECPQCKMFFTIGASAEIHKTKGYYMPGGRLHEAICPNCRYNISVNHLLPFKGDRILVNKFPYEFGDPKRWDVAVFKYPEDAKTNYIKRIVGLPGEMIKIERGDIRARSGEKDEWKIQRKDPSKQRDLQILVYDNDYHESGLHKQGWPERWAPVAKNSAANSIAGWSEATGGWQAVADKHAFQLDLQAADGDLRWIRYRHILPDTADWEAAEQGRLELPDPKTRLKLITDFCGYNAYTTGGLEVEVDDLGHYWVGDLTLHCQVDVLDVQTGGTLLFELIEGLRRYHCRIDAKTGEASLVSIDDYLEDEQVLSTAVTGLKGPGTYQVSFANVDNQLCLWVDGRLIDFGSGCQYEGPSLPKPRDEDLTPVGIAAQGMSVRVSHLVLKRDIYYRSLQADDNQNREYSGGEWGNLDELLSEPAKWYQEYARHSEPAVFERLANDEFLVLGDNSPSSSDSRVWPNFAHPRQRRHAVPRSALVGKAFYVYWPHGVPFMNDGRGYGIPIPPIDRFFYHQDGQGRVAVLDPTDGKHKLYPKFTIPFYPHVSRMHRIR